MAKPWHNGPWRKLRRKILARDGYTCQIKGPRCRTRATDVDHIIPIRDGGPWFDERNLRAACTTCNRGWRDHSTTAPPSRNW